MSDRTISYCPTEVRVKEDTSSYVFSVCAVVEDKVIVSETIVEPTDGPEILTVAGVDSILTADTSNSD